MALAMNFIITFVEKIYLKIVPQVLTNPKLNVMLSPSCIPYLELSSHHFLLTSDGSFMKAGTMSVCPPLSS